MKKSGVAKVGLFIIVVLVLFIFVNKNKSLEEDLSSQDIAPSEAVAVGGGGSSKVSNIQTSEENSPRNRYVSPDNKAPTVEFKGPVNGFVDKDGDIVFDYVVQDDGLIRDCILVTDVSGEWLEDRNNRNYFVQYDYPLQFSLRNVDDGDYKWNIVCEDDGFNKNSNDDFFFSVQKDLPQVLIIPDLSIKEDGILFLNLSEYFSDPKGDELTYEGEEANSIKINIDGDIATIEPDKNWFGSGSIRFTAFDKHDLKVTSNLINVIVSQEGDTAPRFISTKTKDGNVDVDGYVFIECNVTDDEGLNEVSLYSDVSGVWVLEEMKVVSGLESLVSFNLTDLAEGKYEWACLAKDNIGQETLSERQRVEVEIDVELVHEFPERIVNKVDTNKDLSITYSGYLKDSIELGDFTIKKSNGKIYYQQNFSEVPNAEIEVIGGPIIIYYTEIRSIPDELFDGEFEVGNMANLTISIEYWYLGKNKIKELNHVIRIVEG